MRHVAAERAASVDQTAVAPRSAKRANAAARAVVAAPSSSWP